MAVITAPELVIRASMPLALVRMKRATPLPFNPPQASWLIPASAGTVAARSTAAAIQVLVIHPSGCASLQSHVAARPWPGPPDPREARSEDKLPGHPGV